MKHTPISRRDFLKNLGIAGAGTLLAASPWLSAFFGGDEHLKREVSSGNYRARFPGTVFNGIFG